MMIKKECVFDVPDDKILNGAVMEMGKVDQSIKASSPAKTWNSFENIFNTAFFKNPQLGSPLGEAAIKGMVRSINDPYSLFLDANEWALYQKAIKGESFAGIGVELAIKNNRLVITTPLQGSPAEKAGIKPGDMVMAVNKATVAGRDLYEVIKSFDGDQGSSIMLSIQRGSSNIDIRIIRQNIRFMPVSAKIINTNPPSGYISIPYFGSDTDKEIKKALDIFQSKGIINIILDLRNNPGGDFNSCLRACEYFIRDNTLVSVYRKGSNPSPVRPKNSYSYNFRIALLINEGSASAAEVMSCALSGNKKGILIGTQSFGKALVQSLYSLPGNTALKLSTAKYLTPQGEDINHKGLKPDITVQSVYPFPELSKDPCVIKALEYFKTGQNGQNQILFSEAMLKILMKSICEPVSCKSENAYKPVNLLNLFTFSRLPALI